MKSKIGIALCGGLVMALTGAMGPDDSAAPHATGSEVEFFFGCGRQGTIWFNAHEAMDNRPAKGELTYHDVNGRGRHHWFTADIDCVDVMPDGYATFSGWLVETNVPDWEGLWVQIWVYDGGTPGREGDQVAGSFFEGPDCLPFGPNPDQWFDVVSGNLVIHY